MAISFITNLKKMYSAVQNYDKVKKQLDAYKRSDPPQSDDRSYGSDVMPLYPYTIDSLYEIAYYSDVLLTIHRALRTQMFKNGIEIVKSEDTDDSIIDEDEEENKASILDRKELLRFMKNINHMGQEIEDVLEELEDDLNIIDMMFCAFRYDYFYSEQTGLQRNSG